MSAWAPAESSLDFAPATSPRSNSAVIQLATNAAGTLGINAVVAGSPGQVHLTLDVEGYFSKDTTAASGAQGPLGFQTLPICRVASTSNPSSSPPALAAAPRAPLRLRASVEFQRAPRGLASRLLAPS